MSSDKIDCTIFSYQGRYFVLPTVSLAEVLSASKAAPLANHGAGQDVFQEISWKERFLPLIAFDLSKFKMAGIRTEKVAIINALFSAACHAPFYFAIYFDGICYRRKLSSSMIRWTNQENKQAEITDDSQKIHVTVLDLFQISKTVEEYLQNK